jgi:hypothetical protein
MEGPISFWGYKEQESNLILPEHDDEDDDEFCWFIGPAKRSYTFLNKAGVLRYCIVLQIRIVYRS